MAVIDPMQRFLRIKDLNDYGQVSMAFEPLAELARTYKVHVMLVHHLGKDVTTGTLSDAFIGSTAIFASVDIGLLMLKTDDARTLQTDGPQRFGVDIPATVLKYDIETGRITAGQELSVARRGELQQHILDVLADMKLPMAEIKKGVGGDSARTHSEVQRMYVDGLVEREGSGKRNDPYLFWARIPDAGQKTNGHGPQPHQPTTFREQVNQEAAEYIERQRRNPMFRDMH
jgi:hypothetical protein